LELCYTLWTFIIERYLFGKYNSYRYKIYLDYLNIFKLSNYFAWVKKRKYLIYFLQTMCNLKIFAFLGFCHC
jgi:hypothetical protein